MRLLFINSNLSHDYNVMTPQSAPLGGSESAQVYLAVELVRIGHEVHLLTGTSAPGQYDGVFCHGDIQTIDRLDRFDALAVTNDPITAVELRKVYDPGVPIFAWEHNLWNDSFSYVDAIRKMNTPNTRVLCVSEWHRQHFIKRGGLDPQRVHVLRNAVSPFFEGMYQANERVLDSKILPPLLCFTSVPYKGLVPALAAFSKLRNQYTDVEFQIFSSFDLYPPNNIHRKDPQWHQVYESCYRTQGVHYKGNVAQPVLATALKQASLFLYPNIMPETSSIAVMEAMAAGCLVLAPGFGALPETMAGHGIIQEPDSGDSFPIDSFTEKAAHVIDQFNAGDDALEDRLKQQIAHVAKEYSWSNRAHQMETLLQHVICGDSSPAE